MEDGLLKKEDVRNVRKKDLGECELVAIAKTSKRTFWLITNDLGRVFLHPDLNVFDMYKDDPNVKIISGAEWLEKINADRSKEVAK